jgi:hypothetical protein
MQYLCRYPGYLHKYCIVAGSAHHRRDKFKRLLRRSAELCVLLSLSALALSGFVKRQPQTAILEAGTACLLYGPRFLWCSVGRFKKYGLQTASKKEGKPVFVVPHEFCSATMINDPRPGPGEQGTVSRKANVVFREADEERCTVVDPFFVEIIAQRDIVEDEELFIDYGPVFSGWSAP